MILRAVAATFPLVPSAFRGFITLELPGVTELADCEKPQEGKLMMAGPIEGWPDQTRGTPLELYVVTRSPGLRGFVVWRAPLFDSDVIDATADAPYESREWRVRLGCSLHVERGLCLMWRRSDHIADDHQTQGAER